MSDRTLLVRVDGGRRDGLGHLMRCLALTRNLEGRGVTVALLMRERPELSHLLASARVTAVALPAEADELQAAEIMGEVRSTLGGDAILVDLPTDLDREEFERYSSLGPPLALLDDHGPARDGAPLVINAIAHADHLEGGTRNGLYNGPDFIILDPAYTQAPRAEIDELGGRLLVAMGGSDPHGITAVALRALLPLPPEIELHALLGPAFADPEGIRREFANAGRRIVFAEEVENLPRFLATFDLAVLSFGLTAYGAAHLGLPTVLLAHDQDGTAAAAAFAGQHGSSAFVGRHDQVDDSALLETVRGLLDEPDERRRMAERGRAAVDGKGLERVRDLLLELLF